MRIAQVAPLYESVPPEQYGGTERVVSYLTEELVRQGHEVTLFGSGDSIVDPGFMSYLPPSHSGVEDSAIAVFARRVPVLVRHICRGLPYKMLAL
jgi:hypothetical protein